MTEVKCCNKNVQKEKKEMQSSGVKGASGMINGNETNDLLSLYSLQITRRQIKCRGKPSHNITYLWTGSVMRSLSKNNLRRKSWTSSRVSGPPMFSIRIPVLGFLESQNTAENQNTTCKKSHHYPQWSTVFQLNKSSL